MRWTDTGVSPCRHRYCLTSSGVYVINDIVDRKQDRAHPDKRRRPIASGRLPASSAAVAAGLITAASLACAFWMQRSAASCW